MNSSDQTPDNPQIYVDAGNLVGALPRVISDAEFERYNRRRQRDDLRYEAEIPHAHASWWKFRNKVLETPAWSHPQPSGHAGWDHAYRLARQRLESQSERDTGVVIGLIGRHGSGKTELATGLLLLVTAKLYSARYTTLFDLSLELEAALRSDSGRTREDTVAEYRRPRLLVIDDCSGSAGSEAESRCLRGIIDGRYCKKRDTILVTNDTAEGFVEFVGPATWDRIQQGGGFIECNWESFRK